MTSDGEFVTEGAEARLALIALASFSAACTTPTLTPACPFYELTASGPQCGEECVDVLARHSREDAVPPSVQIVAADEDYAIRRRTPTVQRRDLSDPSHAFDAGEIQLADQDKLTAEKRTVALIREVRLLLLTPPHLSDDSADRRYRILAGWEELERRGVPFDDVVRRSLAMSLALAGVSSSLHLRTDDAPPDDHHALGWSGVLSECSRSVDGETVNGDDERELSLVGLSRVALQLSQMTRDDLVDLHPPTDDISDPSSFDFDKFAHAQWVHDRFAQTYVDDWAPTSRALEWRYVHGQQAGCCPPDIMRERFVEPGLLSTYLAKEGCDSLLSADRRKARPPMHAASFARIAAEHLRAGKTEAAADLFRALVQLDPNDASARNNLGFCLIASRSDEALAHLCAARDLYDRFDATNAANIALAHHLVGDDSAALRVARTARRAISSVDAPAWLWLHRADSRLELTAEAVEVGPYLDELVEHVSTNEGNCEARQQL